MGKDVTTKLFEMASLGNEIRRTRRPCAFPCEITGGEARSGPDTSEVDFAEEELPAKLSTRRVLLAQPKPQFGHVRHPELPTDSD